MNAERQTELILSHVETWVGELKRTVQSFEEAVVHAEQRMLEVEQAEHTSDVSSLHLLLTHALQASHEIEERVSLSSALLSEALAQADVTLRSSAPEDELSPLQAGTLVCAGRYRLIQLLHARPRVHLYLARRVVNVTAPGVGEQPLVILRELVLNGLSPELRQRIACAAFAEFAAPQLFGSSHLPGVGDRCHLEGERHYLVMQARQARGSIPSFAILLSEYLANGPIPDIFTALHWSIRLCQTVARLHSMQNIPGEITPDMLLVDREGSAHWAPILLASWPPAPSFWHGQGEEYHQICPARREQASTPDDERVFTAPEVREGLRDERSDVYALGAILYLLFTGNRPPSAARRLLAEDMAEPARAEHPGTRGGRRTERARLARGSEQSGEQGQALIPPRQFNKRITPLLEEILLRAIALNPERRFANAQELADALEGIHLKTDSIHVPRAKASRLRRLLEWIRK